MKIIHNLKIITTWSVILNCMILVMLGFAQDSSTNDVKFRAVQDNELGTINIFQGNNSEPVMVQNAQDEIRPYIHPIVAPDGNGILTQYRPGHHTHQTGLYWGLKAVNGRDYFMDCCRPGQDGYHRKVSSEVLVDSGPNVEWQTVYDLLDENGEVILTETLSWSLQEKEGDYLLDLVWNGEAKMDVTFGEFYVGGLFLRMPWYRGIEGEVVNAAGQSNSEAETQRAIWNNVGVQIEGRDDWGQIAMLDHKDNSGFPISWRVDSQLGIGPSRQIMGDWGLTEGETEVVRYRLVIYTGELDPVKMTRNWIEYNTGQ